MQGIGKVAPCAIVLVLCLAACTGSSKGKPSPSPTAPNRSDPCSPSVAVMKRAPSPTDELAQGIQLGKDGKLNVGTGTSKELRIASNDWNTIDASSYVPICVPMELDPAYSVADRTTINRFQYLADRLSAYPDSHNIKSFYLSQDNNGEALGVVLAFWNQTTSLQRLHGLTIDISESPPATTVTDAAIPDLDFAFVIQPKSIYIREVYVDNFQPAPSTATTTSVSINVQSIPTAFGK